METKPFYQSKVFWFNALYLLTAVAAYFGFKEFTPDQNTVELAAVVVSVINIILRFTVSKTITLA